METGFAFSVPSRYDDRIDMAGEYRESNAKEFPQLFWIPEVVPCH